MTLLRKLTYAYACVVAYSYVVEDFRLAYRLPVALVQAMVWCFQYLYYDLTLDFEEAQLYFNPPPAPVPKTWYENSFDYVCSMSETFFSVPVISLVVIGLVLLYPLIKITRGIFRFSQRKLKRITYRMRGIYIAESMMPGSSFSAGTLPKSQLAFCIPHGFSETHVGYGVRVKGVVVTAKHVLEPLLGKDILVRTDQGAALWNVSYTVSTNFPDVAYCFIDDNILSKLGVTVATAIRGDLEAPGIATMYGPLGKSSGVVRKNPSALGYLLYEGSTIGGMSGGGVWIGPHLVSIHHGVIGGVNSSTIMPFIMSEIRAFFVPEAAKTMNHDTWSVNTNMMQDVVSKNTKKIWTAKDFKLKQPGSSVVAADYKPKSGVAWADEMDEDFDPESSTSFRIRGKRFVLVNEYQSSLPIREPKQVIEKVKETFVPTQSEEKSQEVYGFSCSICARPFKTQCGLFMHLQQKHDVEDSKLRGFILEANFEYQDGEGSSFLGQQGSQPPPKLMK